MKTQTNKQTTGGLGPFSPACLLAALLLGGCVVTSIYPYYTPKDLAFEPALLGDWQSTEPNANTNEFWQFEKLEGQAYKLTTLTLTANLRVRHPFIQPRRPALPRLPAAQPGG